MRHSNEPLRFIVVFLVLSTALGWWFWSATASIGSYHLNRSMLAVPVVSAMLASVGFPWKRKAVYVLVTLGVYALVGVVGAATGFEQTVGVQLGAMDAIPSLGTSLYMAFLATFPLAMLVLFVGRTPALLWSSKRD
jgi:hypothetical protein